MAEASRGDARIAGREGGGAMNEWEWQLLEDKTPVESIEIQGVQIRRGDRVRLRPRAGGDVFDLALQGKIAAIASIEQDYEGKLHICVVLDDDPGRDIGLVRQPGHRFFFAPGEVEALGKDQQAQRVETKQILIAGIGNIFLADDGFGVEVASRLANRSFPAGVRVADFGIRGFDLAYALMEGYETTILVDAYPGAGEPGTLFVVQPDCEELNAAGTATWICRASCDESSECAANGDKHGRATETDTAGWLRSGNARAGRRRDGAECARGSRG